MESQSEWTRRGLSRDCIRDHERKRRQIQDGPGGRAVDLSQAGPPSGFGEVKPRPFNQEPQESGRLLASVGQIPVRTSNAVEVEKELLPDLKKQLSAKAKELQAEKWQAEEERTQAKGTLATYEEIGQA